MDVVKPDPAVTQESPEPIVYRCRKCRRVVARKSNLLMHKPKPAGASGGHHSTSSPAKYASLGDITDTEGDEPPPEVKEDDEAEGDQEVATGSGEEAVAQEAEPEPPKDGLSYVTEHMRRSSIGSDHSHDRSSSEKDGMCRKIFFIEPLAWMTDIFHNTQGRLYCPKCTVKLGSFNWVMGELVLPLDLKLRFD